MNFFRQFAGPGNTPSPRQTQESLGSGVIIDGTKGLVLTNAHVIAGGTSIKARLLDGPGARRDAGRLGSGFRRGRAASCRRGDAAPGGHGRFGRHHDRRDGHRHRQSLRLYQYGDHRRRLGRGPFAQARGRGLRRPHPDRYGDQSRQQRRSAGQSGRRGHRHQHGHPGRRRRHRLRHPHQQGPAGGGPADRRGPGDAGLARADGPGRGMPARPGISASTGPGACS